MDSDPRDASRPPRLLRFLVQLLIRGRDASYIARDLDASFAHDVERGLGRGRAARRYAWNVVAIGAFLPGVGPLVEWAALGLWGYSLFLAIRTILGVSMNEALGICGAALLPPVLLLFWIFR